MQIKKLLIHLFCSFVAFLILGTLLLTAVYCIPNHWFEANVDRSLDYLHDVEGVPYSAFFHSNNDGADINNYSNGHMIRRALSYPHLTAFENALYGRNYARYWHGYLVFLKPLLCLGDVELVRYINLFALTMLLMLVLHLLSRKLGYFSAAAFLISLLFTWYLFVPMSIQYCPVYYILFVFLIILLQRYPRLDKTNMLLLFFCAGMATSYVDLLTAPLLTLSIPLMVLLALRIRDGASSSELWKSLAFLTLIWALGYGAFWAAKWVLASIFLDENVVTDALKKILFWLNDSSPEIAESEYSIGSTILENMKTLFPSSSQTVFGAVVFFLLVFLSYFLLLRFAGEGPCPEKIPLFRLLPIAAVCLYPFLWYSVQQSHSAVHAFFTCKILAIPIFGAFLICGLALGGRDSSKR